MTKEGSQILRVLTKILAKYPAIQISPEIMEMALANKSNADQVVDSLMNHEDQSFEVTKGMMQRALSASLGEALMKTLLTRLPTSGIEETLIKDVILGPYTSTLLALFLKYSRSFETTPHLLE